MRKLTFICLLVTVIFTSCHKDTNKKQESYYFNFKADGVSKSFSASIIAHTDTVSGYVTLVILGANAPYNMYTSDSYLIFYIDNFPSHDNLGPGVYEDKSTSYNVSTTYQANNIQYEAGQGVYLDALNKNIPITHFKATITSFTKTGVQGTFSGDYYVNADTKNGAKVSITDGDFYVEMK